MSDSTKAVVIFEGVDTAHLALDLWDKSDSTFSGSGCEIGEMADEKSYVSFSKWREGAVRDFVSFCLEEKEIEDKIVVVEYSS